MRPEPAAVFTAFFDKHIVPMLLDEECALMARNDLVLKKLILLFAANEGVIYPGVELVERALALHTFLVDSATIVKDRIGSGDFNECMDSVLRLVQKWPGLKPASISEIDRNTPRRFSRELLVKVVEHLVRLERITEVLPEPGARGRPTTRYVASAQVCS